MRIYRAGGKDIEIVLSIVHTTINDIYPRYYPHDVVKFFLNHHSRESIRQAVKEEDILLVDFNGAVVGTASLRKNEIKRMFILPQCQGKGIGAEMLKRLEQMAATAGHETIMLDASWPGYDLYQRHGYVPVDYKKIITGAGQVLCYHRMQKPLSGIRDNMVGYEGKVPGAVSDTKLEYREMRRDESSYVAKLYRKLVCHIKSETKDEYFQFDLLDEKDIAENLQALTDDPVKKAFVAVEGGKIAGFILGEIRDCFLPVSRIKKTGYISAAYVPDGYRGRGIMKSMEKKMIEFFREKQIKYVELNVMSKNTLAKQCWEKMRYSTFREQMRKKIG